MAGLSGNITGLNVNGAGMSGRIRWVETTNEANNTSSVTATLQVSKSAGFDTTFGTFSGYLRINGVRTNWSGSVSVAAGATNQNIFSATNASIPHNADGSKSITITVDGAVSGTTWTDSYGTGTAVLTDFTIIPTAPAAPGLARTTTGASTTITSAIPSSTVTIDDYNYQYSTDNSTWSAAQAMGTGRTAIFASTSTTGYYFQTRAHAADGWGPWSASSFIAGVPSVPSSISATRTLTSVAVVAGSSATNGGASITGYFAQVSSDSGGTWSTAVAMSSQAYTYTGLTIGVTYLFRVYAANSTGNSATVASSGVTITADGATPEVLYFDANPMYSTSYGHNQIKLYWSKPSGVWDYMILTRSTLGFPVTPDDGVVRLIVTPEQYDALAFPLLDYGLVAGDIPLADNQVYYYTVFVRDPYSGSWGNAANTMATSVKNYGTTSVMYDYLPLPYKTSALNTGLTDITEVNADLYNFLSIFGAEYDMFKASAENVNNRYDIAKLDGKLIPLMMQQFGFNYESELGISHGRRLLQAFPYISLMKGTARGIKAIATAFSGYNATLEPVTNQMLNIDDSSFETGLGSWNDPQPVLTTLSRITSGTYQETSLTGFPSLNAGCMQVTGSFVTLVSPQTPTGTTNITLSTASAHGFVPGDSVVISGGVTTGYNGTWTAQTGTAGTTLVLNIGSNPGAISSTPGTASPGVVFVHCGDDQPITQAIPVTVGTAYVVSAYTKAASTTIGVAMGIRWCDRLGATISETISSPTTNTTSWSRISSASLTAPANAVYAVPVLKFNGPLHSGFVAYTHYVDAVQFEAGASATTFADARRVDIYLAPTRTNLAINPSMNHSTVRFVGGSTATLVWTVGGLHPGGAVGSGYHLAVSDFYGDYIRSTYSVDVTADKTYTFSSYLARPVGTSVTAGESSNVGLSIEWYDSSSALIEESYSIYAGQGTAAAAAVAPGTYPAGSWLVTYAVSGSQVSVGDYVSLTGFTDTFYNWNYGAANGLLVTAVTGTTVTVLIPSGTPGSTSISNQSGHINKIAQTPVPNATVKRGVITAAAPNGAATAKLVIKDLGTDTTLTKVKVDGILFEEAGDLRPYFDGSLKDKTEYSPDNSYFNTYDVSWKGNSAATGTSLYYLNRYSVNKRLLEIIPDYLPPNTPWALFYE